MVSDTIDPKDLFAAVSEGDRITWGERDQPLTVYRHVTEDDLAGQVITMSEVSEDAVQSVQYDLEHNPGLKRNTELSAGDLMAGELTGDEFLIARGPRDGCYLLKQWWNQGVDGWSAAVALFRRAREDTEAWTWENTVQVERVGSTDVDRDEFDTGGDWVRHTDVDGRVVWTNARDGEAWDHSEDLTGEPVPELDAPPAEVLETVSEGDTVRVNDLDAGTVTEVQDEDGGALADGSTIRLDLDGRETMVRTYTGKGKAMYRTEDGEDGDVTDVTVGDER